MSWTLDHWGPSPLQPLCALGAGHPTRFLMSQTDWDCLACDLFLPFPFLVVTDCLLWVPGSRPPQLVSG